MSFIKISNEADFVNRLFLEKLGLSTKRDDPDTIGQFGSGTKFAPIAALRKGIRWISVGEDEVGPYQMEWTYIEEGGINCVYCLYDNETLKGTSFTLEAGELSWEDDFQIFREAFANALDEFTARGVGYSIDVVDQIKPAEPGFFSVYISATPTMLDIVENFDKYFSINRTPIWERYNRKIFNAVDGDLAIFCKGVRVFDGFPEGKPPIFNYQFDNLTLNEERRIRYTYEVNQKILLVLSDLDMDEPEDVEIAAKILSMDGMRKHELEMDFEYPGWFGTSNAFVKAFYDRYSEDHAIYHDSTKELKSQIAMAGKKAVKIKSAFLYELLAAVGIPTAEMFAEVKPEFDFIELPDNQVPMFDQARALIQEYEPKINQFAFRFFVPHGEQDQIYGVARMGTNEILISINAFRNPVLLTGTIMHEMDHMLKNHGEHDAEFRSFADDHIGRLLTEGKMHVRSTVLSPEDLLNSKLLDIQEPF